MSQWYGLTAVSKAVRLTSCDLRGAKGRLGGRFRSSFADSDPEVRAR